MGSFHTPLPTTIAAVRGKMAREMIDNGMSYSILTMRILLLYMHE